MKTGIDTIWDIASAFWNAHQHDEVLPVRSPAVRPDRAYQHENKETLLYRVSDISVRVGLFQRIFGVGTIIIHSSDKSTPHIDLVNVKEPLVVKELIHKHVEVMKVSRNIRVSEFLDDGPTAPDPCTHGEHK